MKLTHCSCGCYHYQESCPICRIRAERADFRYEGVQDGLHGIFGWLYTDLDTGSTFLVPSGAIAVDILLEKRERFLEASCEN